MRNNRSKRQGKFSIVFCYNKFIIVYNFRNLHQLNSKLYNIKIGQRGMDYMKTLKVVICLSFLLLSLVGCSGQQTNPKEQGANQMNQFYKEMQEKATEILRENKNADILAHGDSIYMNAKHIEQMDNSNIKTGEKLFDIHLTYKKGEPFEQGMATKLPVGTEVYLPAEKQERPILIAVVNGKEEVYFEIFNPINNDSK